jgi:hypothetical protein
MPRPSGELLLGPFDRSRRVELLAAIQNEMISHANPCCRSTGSPEPVNANFHPGTEISSRCAASAMVLPSVELSEV